ncbi:COG4223 family protein [Loktanella fryxellensis]|uniref:COG4223 family protein n=1 Tax=Loktanella fryxellensis TaxID=245187 RepID=UPI00115FD5F7|nr:hypothetical protein [Loktanella fryxellensis]
MANEPAEQGGPVTTPQSDDAIAAVTAMPPPTLPHATATPSPAVPPQPVESTTLGEAEPVKASEPAKVTSEATRPAPTLQAAPAKQRSVFLPLLLGGLVAGGVGYGTAYVQFGPRETVDLTGIQDQLGALQSDVANMPQTDTAQIEGVVTDLSARLEVLDGRVDDRLAAFEAQIADLAAQAPVMDSNVADAAVSQLSDQIAAQQADLDVQRAALEEQIAATRAEAEAIQAQAVDAARDETVRAALARVQGGLETGAPLQEALDDLGGALSDPVPAALTAVAEGAPTLAALQDAYPDASRAGLAAARTAGEAGDNATGVGAFLRNQLNVRSTAPRDGTSADAVMSRAEDALRTGRLNDALAEIATLPQTARTAMADWIALAEGRAAAIDAADQLSATLTAN